MSKHIVKSVVVTVITFLVTLVSWGGVLAADQIPDGEIDSPQNEANLDYRVSESPYLRLPEEMLNWPAMVPPESGPFTESEDPTAVEIYNVATGEIANLPSDNFLTDELVADIQQIDQFEGLLPPGFGSGSNIESVFPPDGRTRVTPTTSYPWRTVAQLFMTFPNSATGSCSGAIVDDFHVLTAGHCVYSHGNGGWASSVQVIPGMDAGYMPYNLAWATYMRSYTGWTVSAQTEHDWALVTLDRNVGTFTGWMGRMTAASSSTIYTGTLNTAGYPCNVGVGTCTYPKTPTNSMWLDYNTGRTATEYNHWYYMDTMPGQSGSPVWRYVNPDRWILTVHTTGDDGSNSNHGTRLNTDKFDRIITWLGEDTAPTDRADLIDDGQTWSGFSPTVVRPGFTSIHNWSDVRNVGTAASGGFYVSYYASANTTISTGDYLIGDDYTPPIGAFDWADSDRNGIFPAGVPDGLYWVGWIIDRYGSVTEFDESNNTAYKSAYQVLVDGTPPTNPACSETHGVGHNTWQNTTSDPSFTWVGASDGSGSGVYRYNYYWGTNPAGTSTNWTMGTSFDPLPVPSPSTYYLRIRTEDAVGNLSAWQDCFIFKYDGAPPSNPTVLNSNPLPIIWTNDSTVDVSWSGQSDGSGSGVHGFSIAWSSSASTLPDTVMETTGTNTTSPILIGSNWYLHIRTKDNAGNWSPDAAHAGPFNIDVEAPVSNAVSPPSSVTTSIEVSWSGTDDRSGIASYDIQYRIGPGGIWTDWLLGTTSTSATFGPVNPVSTVRGETYYFRSRAHDNAGNVESYPTDPDTSTYIEEVELTILPLVIKN